MAFTKYFGDQILNHIFGKVELQPFTFEIGLFARELAGMPLKEIRVEGYKRVMVPDDDWHRIGTGKMVNKEVITFDQINGPVIIDALGMYKYPNGHSLLIWKIFEQPFIHKSGNIYLPSWSVEITLR